MEAKIERGGWERGSDSGGGGMGGFLLGGLSYGSAIVLSHGDGTTTLPRGTMGGNIQQKSKYKGTPNIKMYVIVM
jgi:hypothetical protein